MIHKDQIFLPVRHLFIYSIDSLFPLTNMTIYLQAIELFDSINDTINVDSLQIIMITLQISYDLSDSRI